MSSSKYEFRAVTEQDYDFIYQVKKNAYQTYVEVSYGNWDEVQQKVYFEKFMAACKAGAVIITKDGKNIGFYNGEAVEDKYEIGNICIIPEFQNQGIGTAVLRDIISENKDKEIHLQYFKQNPVGKLYERLGFEQVGETEFHYQMVKRKDN